MADDADLRAQLAAAERDRDFYKMMADELFNNWVKATIKIALLEKAFGKK